MFCYHLSDNPHEILEFVLTFLVFFVNLFHPYSELLDLKYVYCQRY